MSVPIDQYNSIAPFACVPAFLQQAREFTEFAGSVTWTVATMFYWAEIAVNVVGDTDEWSRPDAGTLFIGDHRDRFEFAPLLATWGNHGRDNVHLVAKPFSMNARIIRSLGRHVEDLVLPVTPGTLAIDRPDIWNRDIGWRFKLGNHLPTRSDIATANARTIERAAELLCSGHIVNIFPAGGVMDAARRPWQRGLGRIIKSLPVEHLSDTRAVLYRFDDFSPLRLLRSLVQYSHGVTPEPYELTLRIGPQGSLPELLGGVDAIRHFDADDITGRLQRLFVRRFRKGRLSK